LVIYCGAAKRPLGNRSMSDESVAESAGYLRLLNERPLVAGCANVWAVFYPRSGMATDTACYNTIESDIGPLKAGALSIRPPEDFDKVRCSAVLLPGCRPVRAAG